MSKYNIYSKEDLVKDYKANILIVHGIAEHLHRYDELVKRLNESGYNVFRFDLPGHGRSGNKRGDVKSIDDILTIINNKVNDIRERFGKKVFMIGHSLGGGITNIYASTYFDIDGYISSGAASDTVKQLNAFKVIPYQLVGWITVKNNLAENALASIKEVEALYHADPYVLKEYKIRYAGEVMIKGIKRLKKNYHNIKMPVLVMHGSLDPIVPKEFSENLFKQIASEDKELVLYEKSLHEIFNDIEKEEVTVKVISWLDSHA